MDGGDGIYSFYSQKGGLRGLSEFEHEGGGISDVVKTLKKHWKTVLCVVLSIILLLVAFLAVNSGWVRNLLIVGAVISFLTGVWLAYHKIRNG